MFTRPPVAATGRIQTPAMIEPKERRRHPRCNLHRKIVFSHGSQEQIHRGLAKNHSRSSLYFESAVAMVPGTLLFIRTAGGVESKARDTGRSASRPLSEKRLAGKQPPAACSEGKTVVVGQVRRCVEIPGSEKALYGTGVAYVSPAV